MENREIRARFAPSPTGELHIGSVRTALFNYLFARATGGKMVLRIEDTDEKRSTDASLKTIINGLKWLGIDWDEGPGKGGISEPYFQSERIDLHREYAQKLVDSGKTYYCDCQAGEVEIGENCNCWKEDQEPKKASGKAVIRFKIPEGTTEVHDLIRGDVSFVNQDMKDFVILKSNGNPVYNFAVVVDDITMGVTHIIRGEDHLSNTPKQILLYKALGADVPVMAHLPLINSPLGGKLSKRQIVQPQNEPNSPKYVPAVNVEWYRDHGFLPEAVVNFLARMGWSDNTDNEFFLLRELEEKFSIDGIAQTPALFDWKKLKWFNGMYIRKLSPERFADECVPYVIKAHGEDAVKEKGIEWARKLVSLYQERVEYFDEIGEKTKFFFHRPESFDPKDVKKVKWDIEAKTLLEEFVIDLCEQTDFSIENLELFSHKFIEGRGIEPGRLMQPVRLAISGSRGTPGIYEVLHLLGKEETKNRIVSFVNKVSVT